MTKTITTTDLTRNYGATMDEIKRNEAVIVTAHGWPQVAIVSITEYEALIEARRALAFVTRGTQG